MVAGDMIQNVESIQTRTVETNSRVSLSKNSQESVLVECTDIY